MLDEDAKRLILLRPYQIHAIESIREASKTGKSGYVWHTTGSGKTLTSYKATRNLLMDIPAIDKAIFLIDRKDLDTQTTMAFQAYANNDLVDVDETDNVNDLKKKLRSDDRQVIVTTIQKMQILVSKRLQEGTPEYNKIKNLKIAFVAVSYTHLYLIYIYNRLFPINSCYSYCHFFSLFFNICQIKSLSKILVWSAHCQIYIINRYIAPMIQSHNRCV